MSGKYTEVPRRAASRSRATQRTHKALPFQRSFNTFSRILIDIGYVRPHQGNVYKITAAEELTGTVNSMNKSCVHAG